MTHDPDCEWQPEPDPVPEPEIEEPEPDPEPPKTVEVEESADAGMIVGIVLGLLLLIGIGVVGFLIWRKRRNRDTGQIGSVKLSGSKEMKSSFAKQTHIVKQDLGEEDEEGIASD